MFFACSLLLLFIMSIQKLAALSYPIRQIDTKNDGQFRNLVFWLEDQKICHYKIEDRLHLKDIASKNWENIYKKYLNDLNCQLDIMKNTRNELLDWLLSLAISLEYTDNVEEYKKMTSAQFEANKVHKCLPISSDNPLDSLDFYSDEFKIGLNEVAKMLDVSPHSDHLITLKAICSLIEDRYSQKTEKRAKKSQMLSCPKLEDFPSGIPTSNDPILDNAARILRLLHLREMRTLQTGINQCIVTVQELTANPKTDERLGKIGFS